MKHLLKYSPHVSMDHKSSNQTVSADETRERLFAHSLAPYSYMPKETGQEMQISTIARHGLLNCLDTTEVVSHIRDIYRRETGYTLADKEVIDNHYDKPTRLTKVISIDPRSENLPELTLVFKRRKDGDKGKKDHKAIEGDKEDRISLEFKANDPSARNLAKACYLDLRAAADMLRR